MLSASRGTESFGRGSELTGISKTYHGSGNLPDGDENGARVAELAHLSGLAGRYATAAFELAVEGGILDSVARDFASLKTMVRQSADLERLVRAPVFSRDDQKNGMSALLTKIGAQPLTIQFVRLLADKRRLFVLCDIIAAFEAMVASKRGEVTAQVISARPLHEREAQALKDVLKAKLGREPKLDAEVDATLLGGLIVKIGSRMIDTSLRTKLNGLRTAMRGG
ncbi:MAG: F0F1 ATP synthase subunit delta [Alphaproteobacteria bacterium]|nr:F0F1 ATP synthase subunit delta [Alphaproteobacteria bacterium]MBV9694199.1 F0F1 ATP synthase subunit delta [Alphaproteobacteria bacterium]